jgi:hypothetical protein
MFKKIDMILLITAIGFTACGGKPRTIVVAQNDNRQQHQRETPRESSRTEVIKEEILIRDNPNLGTKVTVPRNNPTLDIKTSTSQNHSVTASELNGESMERMPFPVDEYRHLKKIGRSTVEGVVFLANSINDQKIMGKKIKLYLNPVTSYSRQWYQQSYLGGYKLSPIDKRLNNYLRVEYSEESGSFRFFGVPRGSYYLIGQVSCGEECGFNTRRSIRLVKEISVGSGITKVELMKNVP